MNMNETSAYAGSVRMGYIPGIDGLRALAVLSVILFHFKASLLPGGFSGVDVFFVISGYVVSGSLAKERQDGFWRFAVDFYSRRILRIYPALVLCLTVAALLQTLFVPPSWLSTASNKTGIAAFFGMSNFALVWFSDGYFSPRVEFNTFTHTWSLAVEEQFYFLFPAIFFIWLKGREIRGFVGIASNGLLPALLAISFLVAWRQTSSTPDDAYYLLPGRFWELACGAMLFKLHSRNQLVLKSKGAMETGIAGGLILIGLGFALSDPKAFPFPWALLPVIGTLLVIAGVASDIRRESLLGGILDNAPIVYIGKISYSLYLWHWPVVVLFRWTVGLDAPIAILSAALLTAAASVCSYHFVERPIRQNPFVISKPNGRIVSGGLAVIVLSALVALGIFRMQPYISLSVTKDKSNWYPYPEARSAGVGSSSSFNPALFQGRKIYVLGDSHAGAYGTMLQMLKDKHGVSIREFSKAGCAVANLLAESSPECSRFIKNTLSKIRTEAASGDIVFLASLRMNRLSDQWATFDESEVLEKQTGPDSHRKRAAALQEAASIIRSLEEASLTVVIDAPKPVFKSPLFRCSDWFNSGNPVCKGGAQLSREYLLTHREPVMESIRQLVKMHPGLVVWDPFPVLCPGDICMATDNDLPVFFDGDHLSGHGNRMLYPSFFSLVNRIWQHKG